MSPVQRSLALSSVVMSIAMIGMHDWIDPFGDESWTRGSRDYWQPICAFALAVNLVLQVYCWILCEADYKLKFDTPDLSLGNTVVCGVIDITRLLWFYHEVTWPSSPNAEEARDLWDNTFWLLFWVFTMVGIIIPHCYFMDH